MTTVDVRDNTRQYATSITPVYQTLIMVWMEMSKSNYNGTYSNFIEEIYFPDGVGEV